MDPKLEASKRVRRDICTKLGDPHKGASTHETQDGRRASTEVHQTTALAHLREAKKLVPECIPTVDPEVQPDGLGI